MLFWPVKYKLNEMVTVSFYKSILKEKCYSHDT